MGCVPQYASGDLRPTDASRTTTRSDGAPMKAQGQHLVRCVFSLCLNYEFASLNYLICIDLCDELCDKN